MHSSLVSKAFTSEETQDDPIVIPSRPPIPAGVTNYVTRRGLQLLHEERERLLGERGALKSDGPDERRAGTILAARIAELDGRIACAVILDALPEASTQVRFGATVTVRSESGGDKSYQIVGVDEANPARGRVAHFSPIARALLGRNVGDVVVLKTSRGDEELEILAVTYA